MVGVNLFAADTDAEARHLFTSLQVQFLNLVRGTPGQLAPPIDLGDLRWSALEQAHVDRMTAVSLVGAAPTVRAGLATLLARTGADEIIATAQIYDHGARLRSFEILSGVLA